MRKLSLPIVAIIFLTACTSSPGADAIQTAIAQTQRAAPATVTPTQAATAVPATNTPTPAPTAAPIGLTRSNPAPVGAPVTVGDYTVMADSAVRPGDAAVAAENMFNSKAPAESEYLLIRATVTCNLSPDQKCEHYASSEFKLVTPAGNVIDMPNVLAGPNMLGKMQHFGGATVKGLLGFIVSKSDTEFVLMFTPSGSKESRYLALDITSAQN